MDQPGAGMRVQPANIGRPDLLVAEAVGVVLACISKTDVPPEDVAPLIEGVTGALAEAARAAARLEPSLRRLGFAAADPREETAEEEPARRVVTAEEALSGLSGDIEEKARELLAGSAVSFVSVREEIPAEAVPAEALPAEILQSLPAPEAHAAVVHEVQAEAPATIDAPPRPTGKASPASRKPAASKARRARTDSRPRVQVAAPSPAAAPLPMAHRAPAARLRDAGSRPKPPSRPKEAKSRLPRGLKSVEEALRMDMIVCLEDGRKVKDLGAHLKAKGIDPADYIAKWGLPAEYPMMAPSAILKRGPTWEFDLVTGRFRPVRA